MLKTIAAAVLGSLALAAPALADPTATTLPIDDSVVTDTTALLNGIVNPKGQPTAYQFQYGTTTSYGSDTPLASVPTGNTDVAVDASLTQLQPNTTYHFRVVATPDPNKGYAIKQIYGEDQSFTTTKPLSIAFNGASAAVAGGKAGVKLKALGPPEQTATGKLTLTAKITKIKVTGKGKKRKRKKVTKTVSAGSATFSVDVGTPATIKVTLSAAVKAALKKGDVKAKASALLDGASSPVVKTLTLSA